jgi:uncharacterized protein YoxC
MKKQTPTKKVTLESIANSIDDLATATARGLKDVEERLSKRIDGVDERLDGVETKVENLGAKVDHMGRDLGGRIESLNAKFDDLNFHKVRDEVFFLGKRVTKIESKV